MGVPGAAVAMLNKCLLSYAGACSAGTVAANAIVSEGVNSFVIDLLVVAIAVSFGPVSALLLGEMVLPAVLVPLILMGLVGAVMAVKGYQSSHSGWLYLGNSLWAGSGFGITTFGFMGACC